MQNEKFIIRKNVPTISKTFRIPVDISQILTTLAEQNHISVNALVVQCLVFALEHCEDEPPAP